MYKHVRMAVHIEILNTLYPYPHTFLYFVYLSLKVWHWKGPLEEITRPKNYTNVKCLVVQDKSNVNVDKNNNFSESVENSRLKVQRVKQRL